MIEALHRETSERVRQVSNTESYRRTTLDGEQLEFYDKVTEKGGGLKLDLLSNQER